MPPVALLDTNVWVSAFLKPAGPPGQVVAGWRQDKFSVVTSLSQLSEISEVLTRPRLARRFQYPLQDAETFVRERKKKEKGDKSNIHSYVSFRGRPRDRRVDSKSTIR